MTSVHIIYFILHYTLHFNMSHIFLTIFNLHFNVANALKTINAAEMFVMNYLSLGCGRSTEVKDAPPFSTVKFIFNRIVHQMRSNKGEAHGQVRNEYVPHYMSPSLSRRFILINVCLKPAIEQSDSVSFPPRTDLAMTGMFRRVMNLQNDLSVRNCRQAMASIHNFMSPAGMSKITVESGMARAFHHTPGVHEASYSAEEMTRLPDGQLAMSDLIAARRIERAMGEPIESFPEAEQNQQGSSMSLDLLKAAARHLYGPTATLHPVQKEACLHFEDSSDSTSAFILAACGHGKSGVYVIPGLTRALNAAPVERVLVISPHNGLLAQHVEQATHHYRGLGIRVQRIDTTDLSDGTVPDRVEESDLLFVSMSAFNILRSNHEDTVSRTLCAHLFVFCLSCGKCLYSSNLN